jgi:hypothetical protein
VLCVVKLCDVTEHGFAKTRAPLRGAAGSDYPYFIWAIQASLW